MLSKHLTNVIQNLEKRKYREKYNAFKVEGGKLVNELLFSGLTIEHLLALPAWIEQNQAIIGQYDVIPVTEDEMARVSNFQSIPEVIAIAQIPRNAALPTDIQTSLSVILNGIQDPGNLGTILRVCDWFGIRYVFCDAACAGVYNPKTVQASMGAVFRVKVFYTDLVELISRYTSPDFPCHGTFLHGENIYRTSLSSRGFIVMGNEGQGISPDIERLVSHRLTIPSFARSERSTESLNVGVATGIILSEFKRTEQV